MKSLDSYASRTAFSFAHAAKINSNRSPPLVACSGRQHYVSESLRAPIIIHGTNMAAACAAVKFGDYRRMVFQSKISHQADMESRIFRGKLSLSIRIFSNFSRGNKHDSQDSMLMIPLFIHLTPSNNNHRNFDAGLSHSFVD